MSGRTQAPIGLGGWIALGWIASTMLGSAVLIGVIAAP